MKSVTFSDFRKQASSFLNDVENGETILVMRHGKAVAEISPVLENESKIPSWKKPGLKLVTKGAGLSKAILEERKLS